MAFSTGKLRSFLAVLLMTLCAATPAMAENMAPSLNPAPAIIPESPRQFEANVGAEPLDRPAAPTRADSRKGKKQAAVQASSPYRYYVEFRSRHALSYGHTFMAYGRLTPDGKIATQTIIGLHPMGDDATWWTIGHVLWVPSEIGPSDGDLEEEYISARYRIDLTQPQYEDVVAFAKKLGRESPMWHAVLYNCSAFVGRIANYMGLQTPSSLDYPADFINGMRRMNNDVRTVTTLGGTPMAQGQSQ